MTKASLLEIESTQIEQYAGDTKGKSIVVTAKGSADKGETAQQYGQHGLISNPAKNTLGLRLTQGSLDIIIAGLNYSVPLPKNMGETLLFSTDADGVVKSKLYLDEDGNHVFNDGEDNGVRYSKLEEAYDELNDKYNALIAVLEPIFAGVPFVPILEPGNGAPSVLQSTIAASWTAIYGTFIPPVTTLESEGDITPSKIEEIKVP